MKLTSLVLAASATTAVLASHIESNSHHQQLERRDPTFGLLEGVLGGLFGHGHSQSPRYPSRNWKCSGRGDDGWDFDWQGGRRPSHIPSGWKYYGVAVGWAPTSNWSCDGNFKFSAEFLSKIHLVTWFKPSSVWIKHNAGINLGVSVPGWWGLLPSSNWQCSGKGNDGFSLDIHGNRPSWVPSSGWAYFGVSFGWMPTASFECGLDFKIPPQFLENAHKCSWWTPSTAWKNHNVGIDLGINVPPHWHWTPLPSANWQCNGSGTDGKELDHKGNGRPSWAGQGWLWWGVSIGWAPGPSFECGADFEIPSQLIPSLHLIHWWTPSLAWKHKHTGLNLGFNVPGHWNWSPLPAADWTCDGSGKDGVEIDHDGNNKPSWVPEGWLWFGSAGWQPSVGWSCGSSWSIPPQWEGSCDKAIWWSPPKPWVSKHHGHGWAWSFQPPRHWGCEVPATITRTSSSSLPAITTSVKPATPSKPATSSQATTSIHKPTTSVKATTTSKPKSSTSVAKSTTTSKPQPTTSSKPKPTSNGGGNKTVTVTITKTVSVPAPTGGGSGSCPCKPEPYRLARREKSRLE